MSENISNSLVDTIKDSKSLTIASDSIGLSFDNIISNELIQEIPIINRTINIYKGVLSIRDQLFIIKLLKFLYSLNSVSNEKREEFVDKISKDTEFKQKLGEHVILILDKLNDVDKAKIIGKLFSLYIEEKISFHNFKRLSAGIDIIALEDISVFKEFADTIQSAPPENLQNMALAGFVIKGYGISKIMGASLDGGYRMTEVGELFFRHIIKDK